MTKSGAVADCQSCRIQSRTRELPLAIVMLALCRNSVLSVGRAGLTPEGELGRVPLRGHKGCLIDHDKCALQKTGTPSSSCVSARTTSRPPPPSHAACCVHVVSAPTRRTGLGLRATGGGMSNIQSLRPIGSRAPFWPRFAGGGPGLEIP